MRRNVRLQSSGIRRSIGVRVELETPAVRVIHQDDGGTVVGVDIADADARPVALEPRGAGGLVVEHSEESGRLAPVLRLAVLPVL